MSKHINKILNKFSEDNKVELAIIDNLRKYAASVKKYRNEGEGLIKRIERQNSELIETKRALGKWSSVGDSIIKDISSDVTKFERQAKELGVDPKSSKAYNDALNAFKEYAKLEKRYENIAKIK